MEAKELQVWAGENAEAVVKGEGPLLLLTERIDSGKR